MTTEIATTTTHAPKPSAMQLMASRCNVDPAKLHQTLKSTVFKGATDEEMLALVVTANTYQLNPLLKEMYAFPKKGGGIVPMVGVDGWLKIANRQDNYDGMSVEVFGDGKTPTHATCEIYLKNRAHPVKVTEYFEECRRNTDPWNQMPRRMIRNKVMIQAIRVAFGIGGIFDEDEATDIAGTRNVTPKPATITGIIDPFAKAEPAKKAEAKAKPEVVEAEPADEQTLDLSEMQEADWGDKEEGQQP
jgi:phage recombination protein Bet